MSENDIATPLTNFFRKVDFTQKLLIDLQQWLNVCYYIIIYLEILSLKSKPESGPEWSKDSQNIN